MSKRYDSMQTFTQEKSSPIKAKKGSYENWINGFVPGTIFGALYLLITISLISIEVSRIITGSLNRNSAGSYQLYPGSIYDPPYYSAVNSYNVERQNHYLWPWSHPALLFACVPILLASLFGFTSGRRGTYSMIYLFFTFSLITFMLTPFLIGYFSVNINRHNTGNTLWQSDESANRDRSFSIVMLALTLFLFLVSLLATVIGAVGFRCCTTKGGGYLSPVRRNTYVNTNSLAPNPYASLLPIRSAY